MKKKKYACRLEGAMSLFSSALLMPQVARITMEETAITLGIYKFVFLYCGSFKSSDHFTLENLACIGPIVSLEQISLVILVTRLN